MVRMADRKKASGRHRTPRVPVQVPEDWIRVARTLAARTRTPVVWYLLDLIKRDAEAAGLTDLPAVPWDADS